MPRERILFGITCAALAGVVVSGVGAGSQSKVPVSPGWPPPASHIVNLDGYQKVSKGRRFTVFEVPPHKALVVTDLSLVASSGTTWKAPHLVERIGKKRVIKRSSEHAFFWHGESYRPLQYSSAVGIVFAPGSHVELQAETGGVGWHYNLTGYLAPPE